VASIKPAVVARLRLPASTSEFRQWVDDIMQVASRNQMYPAMVTRARVEKGELIVLVGEF
jgi:hypothetical protein